jgi:hypothetical protein
MALLTWRLAASSLCSIFSVRIFACDTHSHDAQNFYQHKRFSFSASKLQLVVPTKYSQLGSRQLGPKAKRICSPSRIVSAGSAITFWGLWLQGAAVYLSM